MLLYFTEKLKGLISPDHPSWAYVHLAQVVSIIAKGNSVHASSTLIWLAQQDSFANTFLFSNEENRRPWRAYLVYDAFQLIQKPTKALMDFYSRQLDSEQLNPALKYNIMKALAAHGTSRSMELFEKHMWRHGGPYYMLVQHRDKYECVQLIFNLCRTVKSSRQAHEILGMFFGETYEQGRETPPIVFSEINPVGDDAEKYIELFKAFIADPGGMVLTEEEIQNIKGLIKKIEDSMAEKTLNE